MKRIIIFILLIAVFLLGCSQQVQETVKTQETVFTIGSVLPLTGDAASYGVPTQKAAIQAMNDLNKQWASKNQRLEIIFDDGRCLGSAALSALQNLVQINRVKVIFGGGCSGETLSMAPFAETNQILLFSTLSTSPDVSAAGDFVFRNVASDSAQVIALTDYLSNQNIDTVALLSENTDYAQALRRGYKESLPEIGVEIVADEVALSDAKDVRSEVAIINSKEPDVIIILPQTTPMAGVFAKQLFESGSKSALFGNEVAGLSSSIQSYPSELENMIFPTLYFEKEESLDFENFEEQTGCDLGLYCASAYDGIFLLGEVLEQCGDKDTKCIKEKLYATKNWQGRFFDSITIDTNGDVQGTFQMNQVINGEAMKID